MTEPIDHLQEKVLAGKLLTASAGKAASVIDSFVSWLVVGAGAVLGFLLGDLTSLSAHVPIPVIRYAAILFLLSVALTVVEKYLASIIVGAAEAAEQAAEIGRRLAEDEIDVDFSVVFKEFENAAIPPLRWFVGRSFAKVEKGDFAASGRKFSRVTQVQGLLALIISGLILWALSLVVCALGV